MASVLFDIRELYGKVWGGRVFPELIRRKSKNPEGYIFGSKKKEEFSVDKSVSRPIQSELTLGLNRDELRFMVPPIITLQGSVNVVKTVVAGLDGTIKEIASTNDYTVSIKGFLVSSKRVEVQDETEGLRYFLNPKDFPEKELRQLRTFLEAKKALEVLKSRLLSYFNIKKILVESFSFPELEGYVSAIPFEIEAVSDMEYTLILE